ncbi:hypothetical protein ACMYSQ_001684 [Aspergillus niger]
MGYWMCGALQLMRLSNITSSHLLGRIIFIRILLFVKDRLPFRKPSECLRVRATGEPAINLAGSAGSARILGQAFSIDKVSPDLHIYCHLFHSTPIHRALRLDLPRQYPSTPVFLTVKTPRTPRWFLVTN